MAYFQRTYINKEFGELFIQHCNSLGLRISNEIVTHLGKILGGKSSTYSPHIVGYKKGNILGGKRNLTKMSLPPEYHLYPLVDILNALEVPDDSKLWEVIKVETGFDRLYLNEKRLNLERLKKRKVKLLYERLSKLPFDALGILEKSLLNLEKKFK